jgi:hypothetical protein
VSRIWKALKQAEKERSRSKERKHAGHSPADPHAHPDADKREHSLAHSQAHPHSDGADRRRSERWEQPVPVLVYGSDSGKHPFHEQTETADINDDGCSFTVAATVAIGQRLFLVNMLNDAERECRVVQAGHRSRGKALIAIEFSKADPDFWLPRKN